MGNIKRFSNKDIDSLIDGLIKIFKVEKYALSEQVQIVESLEHGSIIFWRKLWDKMGLSQMVRSQLRQKKTKVEIEAEKYIEMMVVNRCVDPLSKLGATRWIERTCYKAMKGYNELPLDVEYFYRSMDYLLAIKDELEFALFEKMKTLFSINVKLTFYDITSTFFHSTSCPITANGHSRDSRPDLEQIVIGVVTSYEGYPIKHFVFEGNTKDETTVTEVVEKLKKTYNIEETTFVGDRGMITKLNLSRIKGEGFDYIMGVKHRQSEIMAMLFSEDELKDKDYENYNGLKIQERKIKVADFLIWKSKKILSKEDTSFNDKTFAPLEKVILNLKNKDEVTYKNYKELLEKVAPESKIRRKIFTLIKKYQGQYEDNLRTVICLNNERKALTKKKRDATIATMTEALDKLFSNDKKKQGIVEREKKLSGIFKGYKSRFRKFFNIERNKETQKAYGYSLNQKVIDYEEKMDGIFILTTSRQDLETKKVVESYKNLKEVEMLFDDLKNFVDIRPIRHWLVVRVRAHVFICILALLLKRILEIDCLKGKCVMEPLEEISKSKLIKYKVRFSEREDRTKTFRKVTNTTSDQKKYFKMVGIRNPMNLENFVW
ncbi:MAG: IS1634 family transposase [Desulfobacterales bacterium]|nr:IS1634 family transposase [Desulfobacterales bacterium]